MYLICSEAWTRSGPSPLLWDSNQYHCLTNTEMLRLNESRAMPPRSTTKQLASLEAEKDSKCTFKVAGKKKQSGKIESKQPTFFSSFILGTNLSKFWWHISSCESPLPLVQLSHLRPNQEEASLKKQPGNSTMNAGMWANRLPHTETSCYLSNSPTSPAAAGLGDAEVCYYCLGLILF